MYTLSSFVNEFTNCIKASKSDNKIFECETFALALQKKSFSVALEPCCFCKNMSFPLGALCRYWADPDSFEKVDFRIRKFLFLFACTNSCFNPMIYGVFTAKQGGSSVVGNGVFASRERDISSQDQARRGWFGTKKVRLAARRRSNFSGADLNHMQLLPNGSSIGGRRNHHHSGGGQTKAHSEASAGHQLPPSLRHETTTARRMRHILWANQHHNNINIVENGREFHSEQIPNLSGKDAVVKEGFTVLRKGEGFL